MKIGIIGLGYVGLPLAVAFAEAGSEVVGLDVDARKLESLEQGRSYIGDVPDEALAPLRSRLHPTTQYTDLAPCDAVIICVPTPLTSSREPDLTYLLDAATALSHVLRAGQLVVLESTTYPGTTRERARPDPRGIGHVGRRGLPPRLLPGAHRSGPHGLHDPHHPEAGRRPLPRPAPNGEKSSTARSAIRSSSLSTPEAAELSKLLENIFRSVNIAFVNELAQLCDRMGIDVWEVIDAAATKPFGFMRFDPGPGMGGHCLPIDPFYLAYKAREHDFYPEFIELAGKVNQAQPAFCVERIERALNAAGKPVHGSRVLLLGVSYKAGVGDLRESPALKIANLLRGLGGEVIYHDPHVPHVSELGLSSTELGEALCDADLTAIVTAHPELDYREVVAAAPLVLDFRGVTRGIEAANLVRL